MSEVNAIRVEQIPEPQDPTTDEVLPDGYQIRKDVPAGTFAFLTNQSGEIAAIDYICPCGCGAHGCLTIRKKGGDSPSWLWDGNEETPTLEPSIQRKAGCRWHGYLTKGVWRTC